MEYQTENTLEMRLKRVSDAIALTEGDRVPFAPKIGMAYGPLGGVSSYEALMDQKNMKTGVERLLTACEIDLFWAPAGYPANMLEVLGTTAINWPGETCNLPLTSGFQIVDKEYLEEAEYDELINNPAHYFMTKLFPRRHSKLAGLAKLSFNNVIEYGHYAGMQAFADPDVRSALLTLMHAGDESVKWQKAQAELNEVALRLQTPLCNIIGQAAPYDMLADGIRGYLNVPMDLLEIPEKVEAAIEVMERMAMEGVAGIKAAGLQYVFMPLHGGTDELMGNETYLKYYWPSLGRVIDEIVRLGMTPYLFFEGKYHSRLELISELLPPKKCICMFEQIDIAKAKKVLGNVACITGNLHGATLAFGSKQDVIDETKRMMDACAPGGGFIMDCSMVMDDFKMENMEAMYETTIKYRKY